MNPEEFFAYRPSLKKAYRTSDGLIFVKRDDAEAQATRLEDKTVETITRKTQ